MYLENSNGLKAKFSSLGARWLEMHVPDKSGETVDVLLGLKNESCYPKAEEAYYGAVVGRYCGRIANGKVSGLSELNLQLNEGNRHHLHGGFQGFHLKNWEVMKLDEEKNSLTFKYFSKDGEEGFPGNLSISVTYTLTNQNQLVFEAKAHTDKKTLINITNHAFFNLTGGSEDLSGHQLLMYGAEMVQNDQFLLTGDFKGNYREKQRIPLRDKVFSAFFTGSNDSPYDAVITEPKSRRLLRIKTNQNAIQLYNGFFMTGLDEGKTGGPNLGNSGLAIEPQFLFPSSFSFLRPDSTYYHKTIYEFSLA